MPTKDTAYRSLGLATALRATEKALLVRLDDDEYDGREIWIPRSQISEDGEIEDEGDEGELLVSEWFADKEGL